MRSTILEMLLYLIAIQLCSSTLLAYSVPQITLDSVTRDFALWLVSSYSTYKPQYNPTLLNQGIVTSQFGTRESCMSSWFLVVYITGQVRSWIKPPDVCGRQRGRRSWWMVHIFDQYISSPFPPIFSLAILSSTLIWRWKSSLKHYELCTKLYLVLQQKTLPLLVVVSWFLS